jgi:hypothetical protein
MIPILLEPEELHMKNDAEAKAGLKLEEVVSQGDAARFCLLN